MRDHKPEVVVVTGASAGLGRAIACEFAQRGASVGLIARNAAALESLKSEIERRGGKAVVCSLDVADADAMEHAASRIEAELGPINAWVNNAMVTVVSPVEQLEPDEVRRVTEVTYLGTVHGTLAALRRMQARNQGVIVQVGSALAYRAIPLQAPYCGAKFAIRGFTDALRTELIHSRSKVRVTMVQMPALNTPQFEWCRTRMPYQPQPVPPIFEPEVGARAVWRAATGRHREIIVGGTSMLAIWGDKFFPSSLDRWLARTGYGSQLSQEPVTANRQDNLFTTVPGAHRTHGRFSNRSHAFSTQAFLSSHSLTAIVLFGVVAIASAWTARK